MKKARPCLFKLAKLNKTKLIKNVCVHCSVAGYSTFQPSIPLVQQPLRPQQQPKKQNLPQPTPDMFANFDELIAGIKLKLFHRLPYAPDKGNEGYCYTKLLQVSRSFAGVILELPVELRDATCIFYLVLRALDSVEDDTKFDKKTKLVILREFYKKLEDRNFSVKGCGEKPEEKDLLENMHRVIDVYLTLDKKYRDIIAEITCSMGNGMADFIDKKVDTLDDYNLYCHYVAGLVGHGLTKLFIASKCEDLSFEMTKTLSNSMGLFLQKTNIIRDYYEDILENRVFYPAQVWKLYANDIGDFKDPKNIKSAVKCLNHLVTEALPLVPDVLEYLSRLKKKQEVFNFCAIPQVMAIATLAEIYNNPKVFSSTIKIRRGLTARLFEQTKTIEDVSRIFYHFAEKIEAKIDDSDPNANITRECIKNIKAITKQHGTYYEGRSFASVFTFVAGVAIASTVAYMKRKTIRETISSWWTSLTGKQ